MESLVKFGSTAVPDLLPILLVEHDKARENTAVVLGDIGDPSALEALANAAKEDTNRYVRENAKESIEKIEERLSLP